MRLIKSIIKSIKKMMKVKEEITEVKIIEFKNDIETPIKVVKKKNRYVKKNNSKK
jgi:hypothetical protein